MEIEIKPDPSEAERAAILAALEQERGEAEAPSGEPEDEEA